MNLFSGVKKIFLLVGIAVLLCGGGVSAAVVVGSGTGAAYKVDVDQYANRKEQTTDSETGETNINKVYVDLSQQKDIVGTNGVYQLTSDTKEALRSALNATAETPNDTHYTFFHINIDEVYTNKSEYGVTYIERRSAENGGPRVVAVATAADLFIPKEAVKKDSSQASDFYKTVDTQSGLTPGTIERSYAETDQTKQNKELQQQRTEYLRTETARLEAEANRLAAEYETAKSNGSSGEQIAAAKKSADDARKAADESKKAYTDQQEINEGIAKTEQNRAAAEGCSFSNIPGCIFNVLSYLSNIVFKLTAYIVGITGKLLDYSIELSINSAEFLASIGIVEPMWTLIRDILNLSFIFILLWIAINMVLGSAGISGGKTYTVRNDVRNVVLVMILINFSLFFAKLVVDGSNLLTLEIYQQMKPEPGEDGKRSISSQVMNTVGLQGLTNISILGSEQEIYPQECRNVPSVTFMVGVFGSIFMLILAIAFGLAAVLFFIRLPNMVYLFITSPLWVWGHVMKGGMFEKAKTDWSDKMSKLCIFPIKYMLWMFAGLFSFQMLLGAQSGEGTFLTLLCRSTDKTLLTKSLSVILVFCVVIYVMMQAISYAMKSGASSVGGFFAPFAQKVADRAGRMQTSLTTGLANKAKGVAVAPVAYVANGAVNAGRRGLSATSNSIANMLGNKAAAMNPGVVQNILAGTSNRFRNPSIFGKTQEEAEKSRTKKAEESQGKVMQAAKDSGFFKVLSQDDYKGKASYDDYVKDKMRAIANAQLGKTLLAAKNAEGKKDAAGNVMTYAEMVENDAYEDVKDENGNVTGKKLNEAKLWKSIGAIRASHTKGKGKKDIKLTTIQAGKMGFVGNRFFDYKNLRAKGQIEAQNAVVQEMASKATKKERTKESLANAKKDLALLEGIVSNSPTPERVLAMPDDEYFGKMKDYNSEIKKYRTQSTKLQEFVNYTDPNSNNFNSKKATMEAELEQLRIKVEKRKINDVKKLQTLRERIDTLEEESSK